MGTSALLLALTALWVGPEITQNNSWVGPVDQDRCSAIEVSLSYLFWGFSNYRDHIYGFGPQNLCDYVTSV